MDFEAEANERETALERPGGLVDRRWLGDCRDRARWGLELLHHERLQIDDESEEVGASGTGSADGGLDRARSASELDAEDEEATHLD